MKYLISEQEYNERIAKAVEEGRQRGKVEERLAVSHLASQNYDNGYASGYLDALEDFHARLTRIMQNVDYVSVERLRTITATKIYNIKQSGIKPKPKFEEEPDETGSD